MKKLNTKRLCRCAVIAALYVVLTYVFAPFAFGPFQIRPAEALCLLPLLYAEAIPALAVGCMISNLASPYLFYDVVFGSIVSLFAAVFTYLVGRYCKKDALKITFGGLFPVLLNALILPLFIVFVYGDGEGTFIAYLTTAASFVLTQSVWVYALGAPLYISVKKLQNKKTE